MSGRDPNQEALAGAVAIARLAARMMLLVLLLAAALILAAAIRPAARPCICPTAEAPEPTR